MTGDVGQPRIVLCAGPPRCGSTWLYNAARLLLGGPDPGRAYGAWIESWDRDNPAPVHVIKIHQPDESLVQRAGHVLTSRRDLRDVAASAMRRGWTSPSEAVAFLEEVVRLHEWWQAHAAWDVAYERMIGDPPAEIVRVGSALGLEVALDEAGRFGAEIEAMRHEGRPEEGEPYDRVTLLHPDHAADGRAGYYREVLPEPVIAAINDRFGGWLQAHGYT